MNQEIKQEWIGALESEEYQQGEGQLRTVDNKFCCLGVLCDIAAKHGLGQWNSDFFVSPISEAYAVLTTDVMTWAGLNDTNPNVEYDGKETSLAALNDEGKTFAEIAKIIREQL